MKMRMREENEATSGRFGTNKGMRKLNPIMTIIIMIDPRKVFISNILNNNKSNLNFQQFVATTNAAVNSE